MKSINSYYIFSFPILMVFIFFSCSNLEENKSKNILIPKAERLNYVSIYIDKPKVLYIGVKNIVNFKAYGISSCMSRISCKGGGCKIYKNKNGAYEINVYKEEKVVINLDIGIKETRDFEFIVNRIPNPYPSIFRDKIEYEGIIDLNYIRNLKSIFLNFDNFDYDVACKILEFKFSVFRNNIKLYEMINTGEIFSSKLIEISTKLQHNDIINFSNISIICPEDSIKRDLPPMIWTIQ